jgi:hypothetical protein
VLRALLLSPAGRCAAHARGTIAMREEERRRRRTDSPVRDETGTRRSSGGTIPLYMAVCSDCGK